MLRHTIRMMSDETLIYGLRDPQSGLVYYIGKSNDPERRFKSHLADTILRQTKVQWLDTMLRIYQRVPESVILEKVTLREWRCKERF